ncbi:MAG TPA: hypothetical protein VK797_03635 [Tepidisphaeraceae bacterium]|jgi:hypothetical protein|nr:hypothetical protein [Tepidisphaeraceae bacterium]
MKTKDIDRLVRQHLLRRLPNWEVSRGVIFIKPIEECLCSVGFGTSSFDANLVYTEAIVQPLYLPPVREKFKRLKRLKRPGGLRFTGREEEMRHVFDAIREQAIPFFRTADTPEKIAAAIHQMPAVEDPYELEAIAMSCVLLKDREGAQQALARAVHSLIEDGREWCAAMAARLRATSERMESDFEAFSAELPKWRQENLESMELASFQA